MKKFKITTEIGVVEIIKESLVDVIIDIYFTLVEGKIENDPKILKIEEVK